MEKHSLTLAKKIIVETLDKNKELNKQDKLELMMNLVLFLNENIYEDNIKTLNKGRNKWK